MIWNWKHLEKSQNICDQQLEHNVQIQSHFEVRSSIQYSKEEQGTDQKPFAKGSGKRIITT